MVWYEYAKIALENNQVEIEWRQSSIQKDKWEWLRWTTSARYYIYLNMIYWHLNRKKDQEYWTEIRTKHW